MRFILQPLFFSDKVPFSFPPDLTNLDDLLELSEILKIFIIPSLLVLRTVNILFRREQSPGTWKFSTGKNCLKFWLNSVTKIKIGYKNKSYFCQKQIIKLFLKHHLVSSKGPKHWIKHIYIFTYLLMWQYML